MPHTTTPSPTTVLYDGWCSLCSKSADKFRKLDRSRGLVRCVDLRKNTELLEQHKLEASEVRRVLHVISADGKVFVAMDAVRETMRVLGRSWMLGWTGLPIIRWIVDRLYALFARHRLRLFGNHRCKDGACNAP